MKKIILLFFIFLNFSPLYALEEDVIVLPSDVIEKKQKLNENEIPVLLEEKINPYTKEALKGIIQKEYSEKTADGLLKEQLYADFKKGLVKNVQAHGHFVFSFSETIDKDDTDLEYNTQLINIGIKGKFKSEKEGYNFLFDLTPNLDDNFFRRLVLDAWVETKRIPNHTLMFGTYRPNVGYEGGMSAKLTPFMMRSQTSRHFGNVRKTGLRIKGDYKYIDYDLGAYSSDVRYHEFMPGVEGDFWLDLKPLANFDKKYGTLHVGSGLAIGKRNSQDFCVFSQALRYEYKNFWLRAEYQNADGSNGGTGFNRKERDGYNLTLAYKLSKKLELVTRLDVFDNDKKISNNNSKEYSAGLNYYIFGQAMRLMLNYIFCENDLKKDSHKILLGAQLIL